MLRKSQYRQQIFTSTRHETGAPKPTIRLRSSGGPKSRPVGISKISKPSRRLLPWPITTTRDRTKPAQNCQIITRRCHHGRTCVSTCCHTCHTNSLGCSSDCDRVLFPQFRSTRLCITTSIRLTLNIGRVAPNPNLCPHCPRDKIHSLRRQHIHTHTRTRTRTRTHTSIGSQLHHGSAGSSLTRTLILFPTTQNTRRRQHTRSPTCPSRHSLQRGLSFRIYKHDILPTPTRPSPPSPAIPSTVASNQTARPRVETSSRICAPQATSHNRRPPTWSPPAGNGRFQTLPSPQILQAIQALDGILCPRGVRIALGNLGVQVLRASQTRLLPRTLGFLLLQFAHPSRQLFRRVCTRILRFPRTKPWT